MHLHETTHYSAAGFVRCLIQRRGMAGLLAICAFGLPTGVVFAQQIAGPLPPVLKTRPSPSAQPNSHPNARVDVTMVLVPVTVTDQMDRPVMDLKPDAFKVFEDGVEQTVVS